MQIPTHGLPRNIRRYSGESINFADRFADLDIVWEEVVFIGIYGRHEDMFTVFPAISSTKAAPKLQGVPMVVYGHTFRIELQSVCLAPQPFLSQPLARMGRRDHSADISVAAGQTAQYHCIQRV